jgi:hypothetical protein
MPGITEAIELRKQGLVRSFLKLLDRKPFDKIRFPFGE